MICPNCNKENNPGVSFCVNCGTKLNAEQQQSPNNPPTSPYEYKDPSVANTTQYNPNPMPSSSQFVQNQFQNQTYTPTNNFGTQQARQVTDDATENAKAKKYAIISLCLYFGRYLLSILGLFLSGIGLYNNASSTSGNSYSYHYGSDTIMGFLFEALSFGCFIASIVLISIAKAKNSKRKLHNTFVNVVFWIEIGCIIASVVLTIIAFVLLFSACGAIITSCD